MRLLFVVHSSPSPVQAGVIFAVFVVLMVLILWAVHRYDEGQNRKQLSAEPPLIEMTSEDDRKRLAPVIYDLEKLLNGPLAPDPQDSRPEGAT